MALSLLYTDYPLVLDADTAQGGTAVYVNGTTTINPQLTTAVQASDGSVYNTMAFLQSGEPVASFSSADLKAFLDECGVTGMLIDSGDDGAGVIVYYQKYAAGGTRASGSVQHSTTIGDGLLVPRSISLPHRGIATLTAEVQAISSNGVLNPLTFAETAALPAATYPAVDATYTLGMVDLNSTQIQGVINVSIDFGIQIIRESSDSDVYPTIVSIQMIQPSITVTTRHLSDTTTLTEAGVEYAASLVEVYARKRDEGGTFVADGTAEHIKFAMGKCRVDPVAISGGGSGTLQFRITPWYTSGGSAVTPITINTAIAIT